MKTALLENRSIVIADDDAQFGAYLQDLLESWGCSVYLAIDGAEALLLLESAQPDLVLTDLSMPTADGLEVIMGIRRINPDLPVIAMSGAFESRNEAYLGVSKKLGANLVLAKPFTAGQLREAMEVLLPGDGVLTGQC